MGDAAGQPADGFHPLRLKQLVFQLLAFALRQFTLCFHSIKVQRVGDISGHFEKEAAFFIIHVYRMVGRGYNIAEIYVLMRQSNT